MINLLRSVLNYKSPLEWMKNGRTSIVVGCSRVERDNEDEFTVSTGYIKRSTTTSTTKQMESPTDKNLLPHEIHT